jgi:hypothetical protein
MFKIAWTGRFKNPVSIQGVAVLTSFKLWVNKMWVVFASILWMGLGCLVFKIFPMPKRLPRLLSHSLYWIGIPLQILALARRADFSHSLWLPTLITLAALFLSIGLVLLCLQASRAWELVIYNFNVATHRTVLEANSAVFTKG